VAPAGQHCAEHEPQRRARTNRRHAQAKHHRQPRHGINSTAAWRKARASVLQRDGGCIHCGSTTDLTAHHIAGYEDPYNTDMIVTLCRRCHGSIHGGNNSRRNRVAGTPTDTTAPIDGWFG
jgi:5-methylcytosine-specific restriction endonuclease McrA